MAAINPENVTFLVKQFDERLPPQKPSQDFNSPYNDKVLCGNWQENLSEYVRNIYPMVSEYMKEYYHPSIQLRLRKHLYDNKLKGWGTDWHTVNDQGLPEEFYNNFSTLYDLAYNGACPKVINRSWRRFHSAFAEYRPQQDMMNNFGNTVNYGLTKYKEEQWEEEKLKDIGDALTTYQVTYVPQDILPKLKKERFHRWLLLIMLNISVVVKATVSNVLPCGPDIMCEGKNSKNNPEYFKPSLNNLRRCYCDEECVEYSDCCVDLAPFPYTRNENITWSCVAKSYNETVFAVSNCIAKEGWSKLCKKEIYVEGIEYLSDLAVFSNYTGLYYANVYCAFCDERLWLKYGYQLPHYFNKSNLLTQCTPKINLNMLKTEGQYLYGRLVWKVRDGYCVIFQQEDMERGRPCLPSISSCPIGADKSLSDKCTAYSQLLSKNDTVFRNPHCAICNGEDQFDSCKYEKPFIEFHELTDIFSLDWNFDDCQENMHISDNLHNECKAVNCDLESGKCQINKCVNTCKENFKITSEWIIYPCLSASIVCLLIHVYKAIFISPPKNLPSKILNSLAWSLLIAQTLFLTSMYSLAKIQHYGKLCYITAVAIQYFFITSFLWMNVISFDIWFTFSNTFKIFSNSYRKYAVYAWGSAGIIVIFSVIIDQTDYFPSRFRPRFGPSHHACWFGSYNGIALYLAFPIGSVLFLNAVFFSMTICLFRKQKSSVIAISGIKEYSLLLMYIKISTVIGITWVATFLIMAFNLKDGVQSALSILNSLQGVFIFVMFDVKTNSIFRYVKLLLLRIFGNR